jgi:hypothetical protein
MLGFELNALSLNALYLLIHASNTFYLGMLFLDRTCLQGAGVTGVYHQAWPSKYSYWEPYLQYCNIYIF